ncbi:hypothetical protein A3Q32_02040 [Alcanivorax sp. KX64203]|nr:hypothetical protein A3Q32_02040 [Alcanivorax sp. KX64203]
MGKKKPMTDKDETPLIPFRVRMQSLVAFLRLLRRQFVEDGCLSSAAALTYTTLFAIVPVMTVMFTVISAIPALNERGLAIRQWAFQYFVPSAGDQILRHLEGFSRQATNLTVVGALFLVVTSVLMLRTIEQSLNRIWRIGKPRKGLTSLMMYWAVLSLGPILLGAGLGISSYLTSVSLVTDTVAYLGGDRFWLRALPVVMTTGLLSLLYIVVPNTSVPIRQGILGALLAALAFELAKGGFAFFIRQVPSYQVIYGAFAMVPVFLLWIYISWIIVLAGAELVRGLVVFEEFRRRVPRTQSLLRLLCVLWTRQRNGEVLRHNEVQRVLREAGVTHWDEFRNLLEDRGLMRRTDEGGYMLSGDLRSLTLAELLAMLPWTSEQQLSVNAQGLEPWETVLKARCDQAREGMREPLSFPLETLFENQLPETGPDPDLSDEGAGHRKEDE